MPTITFDAPEKLAQKIAALPESQRDAWINEVLEDAFDEEADNSPSDSEIAAIKEGIADVEAGRVHDGASELAGLRRTVTSFWQSFTPPDK